MASWANLGKMRVLNVGNNSLTGTLPGELPTVWPHLEEVKMTDNQFNGSLPPIPPLAHICQGQAWLHRIRLMVIGPSETVQPTCTIDLHSPRGVDAQLAVQALWRRHPCIQADGSGNCDY